MIAEDIEIKVRTGDLKPIRVLSASNGEEALRLCEKETPSLAILNVVMPHMGGAATAAELLERFPGPPILFKSGYSESTESADPGVVLPSETLQSYISRPDHSTNPRRVFAPQIPVRARTVKSRVYKRYDPEKASVARPIQWETGEPGLNRFKQDISAISAFCVDMGDSQC